MLFRNYKIAIGSRNGFVLPENIPAVFGCSVSEPSAFADTPRGLTFTKEDQTVLNNHPVFTHLHSFVKQLPGSPPEQAEIDNLIWSLLKTVNIIPSQVNFKVTYVDTVN
jgi:hypothetical protein